MNTKPKVVEHFDHDDCPLCGTPSVPYERVSDQQLRGCPKCEHQWWEDFNEPPRKHKEQNRRRQRQEKQRQRFA